MSWLMRFKLREYMRSSIWIVPLIWAVCFSTLSAVMWRLDYRLQWEVLDFSPNGARAMLAAIVGSMITFVGFVFSTLLISVQFAGSQMTPRVVKTALTNPVCKTTLGMFLSTFIFSTVTLSRTLDDFVPQLALAISIGMVIVSLIMFLFLLNHITHSLRPVTVVDMVGRSGIRVIDQVYPDALGSIKLEEVDTAQGGDPVVTVENEMHGSVVMAVDVKGLTELASRHDAMIELVPTVGAFVPTGGTLFRIYSDNPATLLQGAALGSVRGMIALGPERTMQQDPTFALRILLDIAARALSPGINDPTTAVVALDQIHALLRCLGGRELDRWQYRDDAGIIRFEMTTPGWEDVVDLGFDEIHEFGGTTGQVKKRLRAMLEDLLEALDEVRHPALHAKLDILNASKGNA